MLKVFTRSPKNGIHMGNAKSDLPSEQPAVDAFVNHSESTPSNGPSVIDERLPPASTVGTRTWRWLGWILGLAVLAYVVAGNSNDFHTIDWSNIRLPWLIAAVLFALGAQLGMILRWRCLLPGIGIIPAYRDVMWIGFLGALCNYSPTGAYGSMGVRGIWLVRSCRTSKVAAAASVFCDRAIGFVTLLVTGAVASCFVQLSLMPSNEFVLTLFRSVTGGIVAVMLAGMISLNRSEGRRRLVADDLWWGQLPIVGAAHPFRPLSAAFAISFGSQLAAVASLGCTASALGWGGSDFAENMLVLSWTELATALTPTPGGIGIREAVLSASYELVGSATGERAAVVAVGHRIVILLALGIGNALFFMSNAAALRTR